MKINSLFIILLSIVSSLSAQELTTGREQGQLLVMLRHNADLNANTQLRAELEALGVTIDVKLTKTVNVWMFTFDESTQPAEQLLQKIKKHPAVEIAQFNHKVQEREIVPNDPSFNLLWQLKNTGQSGGTQGADIHATQAWEITTNGVSALGDTIVIAVVDGGVDLTHEDLNLWKNYNEIPSNGIDDDSNGYVDDFNGWNAYTNSGNMVSHDHGTHVIGIAAAKTNNGLGISGASFGAKVLPIAGSSTNEATVVKAYDYVYTMRKLYNETNGAFGAYIVSSNSSFGVDGGDPADYPLWGAMYDSMGLVGVLSVGSTANRGWDIDVNGDIPTAMANESLITVTNTTNQDIRNSQAGWGFNSIDLGAPGTSIYSTRQGNQYGYKTGTSMSSPLVSGSVALMVAATDSARLAEYNAFPSLGVSRYKRYLIATVDTIASLVGMTVSGGRLNLLDALTMAANPPVLSSDSASIYVGLMPDSSATVFVQISSTSTEPDLFYLSLPPDSTWVSTNISDGILMPGQPQSFRVFFDATGLAEGTYNAALSVNDYFLNQLVIPVTLLVDQDIAVRNLSTNASVTISPNPFEDLQKVNINLMRTTTVNVKVVDIYGRTIAQLHSGVMRAGVHSLVWNGRNSNDQIVGTGVYFIVVTDNYGSVTKKTIKK
jgi:hypothetical protein